MSEFYKVQMERLLNAVNSTEPLRFTGSPPAVVGWYVISDGAQIQLCHKPRWLHRQMARLLLGWRWIDVEDAG